MMGYCEDCGEMFEHPSPRAIYCPDCREKRAKK